MRVLLIVLLMSMMVSGCEDSSVVTPKSLADSATSAATPAQSRWYSTEQVAAGEPLFQTHCAECHGANAEGTPNWREAGPDGKYPPPPLNGTAHAWHHPLNILRQSVRIGGVPLGGSMPPFGDKLDARQIDAVLAWVQSHWSDEIYAMWKERNAQSTAGLTPVGKN